ncbi:baseplate J/gp47 family protein [Xenorhabdus nematophila]|uniref:baseplate J/gp47 family protein n=1 Tax=Xenorhabdus nematophila TaxID=628 RepID=UPI000542961C|nr:baseplate J/gp47 family protein [Xenorhabdus nematophila]CEF30148.1 hypothetical protein XNW1_2260039 [Xenorhabdus nematophila str. Websteri]
MPYKAPTLSTLIARNQADIESRLPGTYARTAFRTTNAIAYANAGNAAGLHDHLAWISRQVIPHLADDDKLLEHCEFWGVWRKAATNARGTLTVTVSAETLIPGGTRWQRPDGVVFESIDDVHAVAGDNPVSVTAIETGRTGNTAEGVLLTGFACSSTLPTERHILPTYWITASSAYALLTPPIWNACWSVTPPPKLNLFLFMSEE